MYAAGCNLYTSKGLKIFVWAAYAQSVAGPGTQQHPAKDMSSTCEMKTAGVHKEQVKTKSASSPESAEREAA